MRISNNMLKCLFLCLCGIWFNTANAQKPVIANTGLNVLYIGIHNKVDIACYGIERKNLEVYAEHLKIKDSIGYYFISVEKKSPYREVYIKIRDKQLKNKVWKDSVLFRIKRIPKPVAQLGTLQPGSYQRGEIAMQHSLYAYLDGFIYDGLKFTVTRYNLHSFDINTLSITRKRVTGNTAEPIGDLIESASGEMRIVIDSIMASRDSDTLMLNSLTYHVKGKMHGGLLAEMHDGNAVKFITGNNEYQADSAYGNYRILKRINGIDTMLLAERTDSSGKLISFKRYYEKKQKQVKLDVTRNSDSSYHIRYFDSNGICLAEGASLKPMFEILMLRWEQLDFSHTVRVDSLNNYTFVYLSQTDSFKHFFERQRLMPGGEWRFYHVNGRLHCVGSLKPNIKRFSDGCYFGVPVPIINTYAPIGLWQVFDINGNLIEEKDFGNE
jgi:hypothetical protein